MVTIVDASCNVVELPQRPLRRVAVSLSQKMRDDHACYGFCRHGRSRRSLPQEDVDEKAKSPRPKKELRVCPNVGRKALQISAVKAVPHRPAGCPSHCNTCDGWPPNACDAARARTGSPE